VDVRYQYTIDLPESMELVTGETEIEKSGDIGQVSIKIEKEGGKVSVDRHVKINKGIISSEEYPTFREMVSLWKKDDYKTLTLKEKQEE